MSTRDSVSAPSLMVFDTNLCIARRYPGRTEDRRGGYVVRALKKKKEKNYHNFRETPALTGVPFGSLRCQTIALHGTRRQCTRNCPTFRSKQ